MAHFIPENNLAMTTVTSIGDNEIAYIAAGITVTGTAARVLSASALSTVIIDGTLVSTSDAIFTGGYTEIGSTGKIVGRLSALAATVDGGVVYNEGSLFGDKSAVIHFAGLYSEIHNSGKITAGLKGALDSNAAIEVRRTSGDTLLENSGTIEARAKNGLAYRSDSDVNDTIINDGKIIGNVRLGGGTDKFDTRDGTVTGKVDAGAGADTLYGSTKADTFDGGADNDKIYAYAGNDILSGGDGDDYISAGDGNDQIIGGLGKDELRGGAGADRFIFKSADESTVNSPGRDLILDFSQSQKDKIDLSAIDAKISSAVDNSFSFIGKSSYSEVEGQLRYKNEDGFTKIYGDTNGNGTSEFAIWLKGTFTLTAADFIL